MLISVCCSTRNLDTRSIVVHVMRQFTQANLWDAEQEKRSSHTLNTYGTESQDTLLYDVRLKRSPIFTSTITEVTLSPLKSSITGSVQARREPGRTQM